MKKSLTYLYVFLLSIILTFAGCENYNITQIPTIEVPAPLTPSQGGITKLHDNIYLGYPDSNTKTSPMNEENFLLAKDCYVLSYDNTKHNANWVSWHLTSEDMGYGRNDQYHHEELFPDTWEELGTKYSGSGFSRGHMCPNGERNRTEASAYQTYSMANIVPQAQSNNGGGWLRLEEYLRYECNENDKEAYIVCGTWGIGGIGRANTNVMYSFKDRNGVEITVPAYVWKVALLLPKGIDDITRINNNSEEIEAVAIWMPNDETLCTEGEVDWSPYQCSIDFVERVTGYDFFNELDDTTEALLESQNDDPYKEIPPYIKK